MLGANLSWGFSVVGTRQENHRARDVLSPDVVENDQGQRYTSGILTKSSPRVHMPRNTGFS